MHSTPLLSPTQGAIDCGCHSGAYGMGADSYGMGADFLDSFVSGLGDAFSKEAGAAAAKALVGAGTNALLSSILPKKPKAPAASTEVQQLPQPQYQPQYQQPNQYQPTQSSGTNGLAIASFLCSFFIFPLGIIFGHIALSQINRSNQGGKGLATAGLIISYLALAFVLFAF